MSLNGVISTATSALLQTQFKVGVTNTNISNADDATYSRKVVSTTGGVLGQVTLSSTADVYLTKALIASSSKSGSDAAVSDLLSSYDVALGSTSDSNDLSSLLSSFNTALTALAATSSDVSAKSQVVSNAQTLADSIRALSSTIQDLRGQADSQIATDVDTINTTLKTLSTLNDQIASAGLADTTDLQDQRQAALQTLSGLINVSYYYDSNNRLQVYSGGQQLLGSSAATVSFTAASSVGEGATYPGSLSGVSVNGKDITSSISSGALAGLLSLRDSVLLAEQDKVDAFASALIQQVNGAVAEGSSYPAPTTLTGAASVASGDALSATGTLTLAVTDSTGNLVSRTDLDLSQDATIDDLVSAINGISGLSAQITSDGKLSISSQDSSKGVAISSVGTNMGDGQTFSAHFGFNAIFAGTDATDITVSSSLVATPSTLATSKLDTSVSTVGATAIASGDASTLSALQSALNGTTSFPAAGNLAARSGTLASYASDFVSAAASLISNASSAASTSQAAADYASQRVQDQSGVNVDEELALLTTYQNQYAATAQLITAARTMFDALITMVE